MKNLFLLTIAMAILALTFGCGSTRSVESASPEPEIARASPSPSPSPTPDQKAQTISFLKRESSEVFQSTVEENDDSWKQEVKGASGKASQICQLDKQHNAIYNLMMSYRNNKEGVRAEDFGTTDKDLDALLRGRSVILIKALVAAPAQGLGDDTCDGQYSNGWLIAKAIYITLDFARMKPEDAGLTAQGLRGMMRQALKGRVQDWRAGKDGGGEGRYDNPPAEDLLEAFSEYGFIAADLGLSDSDLEKVKAGNSGR